MFSQAFRQKQQPQTLMQQQLPQYSFHNQLQSQQQRAQTQQDSFSQMMASTKRQNSCAINETICESLQPNTSQQFQEVYRILEQLQGIMTNKFNDFSNMFSEHDKLIRPLIEHNLQVNQQLNSVLQQSEKVLQQLTQNLDKSEQLLKKRKQSNVDLAPVSNLISKLDERLNQLTNEVEQMSETNNRFQIHMLEIVNIDKLEHQDNLSRVLQEMDKAKRSLSKKMRR